MDLLISQEELDSYTSRQLVPIKCAVCNETFCIPKNKVLVSIKRFKKSNGRYKKYECCSMDCVLKKRKTGFLYNCETCGKLTYRTRHEYLQVNHHFCSCSCAAKYTNSHKTKGSRRSKLEMWLELKLLSIFPDLQILFNNKTTINSELDIYIPSLKLAFELNGIFHYEPIFGIDKLSKIKNNDKRKFQACLERGIELVIIDNHHYEFREKTAGKFLKIILKIVRKKVSLVGPAPTLDKV